MNYISKSIEECDRFGFNIGRAGRLKEVNTARLLEDIIDEKYDMVKLKIELGSKNIFEQISKLPYFHSVFNIIALQEYVFKNDEELFVDKSLEFCLYDGSNNEAILELLHDIISFDTNIYYNSNIQNSLIKEFDFWDGAINYYLSMNNKNDPNKFLFIVKYSDGSLLGLCSFFICKDKSAEGVIFGIRPKYRGSKFATSLLNFSLNTLRKNGVKRFFTEVQYFNYNSLYPHIKAGFNPAGLYLNIILYPLLQKSVTNTFTLPMHVDCIPYIYNEIKNLYINIYNNVPPDIREIKGDVSRLISSPDQIQCCIPILERERLLIRVFNKNDNVYIYCYF